MKFLLCFMFMASALIVTAQDKEPVKVKQITIEGKVTAAHTQKGIKATIHYQSIPTGSITGRFNDSTFSFTIFGSSKYQIVAMAPGYYDGFALVEPKLSDAGGKIIHNIQLNLKGENIVLDHLIFEQGKGEISPESFPSLDEVVVMLNAYPSMVVQLEGHTDNQGNAKMNMDLSQDRVDNVKKYFVSKGIDKGRVKTKAFGGTKPIQAANSPEARARNRRVEMRILKD